MKFILTLTFLFCISACFGQQLSIFENRINSTNHEKYFADMKRQAVQHTYDSIFSATVIISELSRYDRKKYNGELLQPYLNRIYDHTLADLQNILTDNRVSEALGSNWGGPIINPQKEVRFNKNRISFFTGGTLRRSTFFRIVTKPVHRGSIIYKYFTIAFSDNSEEWRIELLKDGAGVPFHGKANKPFLLFSYNENCVCGCAEELYSEGMNNKFQ